MPGCVRCPVTVRTQLGCGRRVQRLLYSQSGWADVPSPTVRSGIACNSAVAKSTQTVGSRQTNCWRGMPGLSGAARAHGSAKRVGKSSEEIGTFQLPNIWKWLRRNATSYRTREVCRHIAGKRVCRASRCACPARTGFRVSRTSWDKNGHHRTWVAIPPTASASAAWTLARRVTIARRRSARTYCGSLAPDRRSTQSSRGTASRQRILSTVASPDVCSLVAAKATSPTRFPGAAPPARRSRRPWRAPCRCSRAG